MMENKNELDLYAVLLGQVISIDEVDDPVFSDRFIGDGYAIKPTSSHICAPADGKIIQVAETKHAYYLEVLPGVRVLIHIGKDTVMLASEGMESQVKAGDLVKQGDVLGKVDLDKLEKMGYSATTSVIVLYDESYSFKVTDLNLGPVTSGQERCCRILFH